MKLTAAAERIAPVGELLHGRDTSLKLCLSFHHLDCAREAALLLMRNVSWGMPVLLLLEDGMRQKHSRLDCRSMAYIGLQQCTLQAIHLLARSLRPFPRVGCQALQEGHTVFI